MFTQSTRKKSYRTDTTKSPLSPDCEQSDRQCTYGTDLDRERQGNQNLVKMVDILVVPLMSQSHSQRPHISTLWAGDPVSVDRIDKKLEGAARI